MATTFIINTGSTSRKYALYTDGICVVNIQFETTGAGFVMQVTRNKVVVLKKPMTATEFAHSAEHAVLYIVDEKITTRSNIKSVGVRVVAPGTYFTEHKKINKEYLHQLRHIADIAPLHVPELINEIQIISDVLPGIPIYGVSDSAFHVDMPEYIRMISIPKSDVQKYDIHRFGYHGLSFSSISRRLKYRFGKIPERTIVCHIGGGISITALKNGKSIATSMGYSPVSGVVMGSRGGDITAGVVTALTVLKRLHGRKLYDYLYTESGFKGVTGVSDLRLVLERRASCDPDALLAIDMFVHEIHSWIGSHAVLLGGIDAIVLTATASERNPLIRKLILENLDLFGVVLDEDKNESLVGKSGCIHAKESDVEIAVIQTDEMGEIDREVANLQ